jgi:hypothetical protein
MSTVNSQVRNDPYERLAGAILRVLAGYRRRAIMAKTIRQKPARQPWVAQGAPAPDPYRKLAAAILKQAAKDAAAGDLGAAEWLQDGGLAGDILETMNFDRRPIIEQARHWAENPAGAIVIRVEEA